MTLPPLNLSGDLSIPNALAGLRICQSAFDGGTFMDGVEAVDCGNCVAVAPRGSKTAADWLRDADFGFAYTKFGKVHKGFWAGLQRILAPLSARVSELGGGSAKPVMCFGHSLGAAETKLFAMSCGFPVAGVVTFGCPRAGDATWRDYYDATFGRKTWDFVNGGDIVPRIPPGLLGYRLTEKRAFLPENTDGYELDPGWCSLAWQGFLGEISFLRRGRIADALADPANEHHLENYAARIGRIR